MNEITEDHIPSTADFWRSLGHNVIPAKKGKPIEDWKRWQGTNRYPSLSMKSGNIIILLIVE